MKAGVTCNHIYNEAVAYVEANRPDLVEYFTRNCGFGMGIEFRESQYLLSPKSVRPLQAGQIINLTLGFQNLETKNAESKGRVYSLFVGDTVQITKDEPIVLTDVDKSLKVVSYMLGDDDDEMEAENLPARGAILDKKLRNTKNGNPDRASNELKRRAHQKMLADARNAEGLKRYSGDTEGKSDQAVAVFRKFESYRKDIALPKTISDLRVTVV